MQVKLLISELAARSGYVTREAYYVMQYLIDHYGWHHMETSELAAQPHSLRERMRDRCGTVPEVVLFWEGYHVASAAFLQIYNSDFRVAVFCEDLHWFNEGMKTIRVLTLVAADIILASYAPVFDRFYPEIAAAKRVVWAPHAASPEFMLPMNRHPDNAILLSGSISGYYPLRQRMRSIAGETGLNITELAHPGYHCRHDHRTSESVGAGYARQINRFRAAFTDSSKFNYVLAKYFEIPATGSLLLGDESVATELARLGFEKWVHYMPVAEETLKRHVEYALDEKNHDELDLIRRNGQALVWERHKICDRADFINETCTRP